MLVCTIDHITKASTDKNNIVEACQEWPMFEGCAKGEINIYYTELLILFTTQNPKLKPTSIEFKLSSNKNNCIAAPSL